MFNQSYVDSPFSPIKYDIPERRSFSPSKQAKIQFNMQSPVKDEEKRSLSPPKQAKVMFNQVSRDSPFKRYKLNGEPETSSDEDDMMFERANNSALFDQSILSNHRFAKGRGTVADPTDPASFYDQLKKEGLQERQKAHEKSPYKNHTPFQAVMEAR